jgi:hypothetical protein
VGSVGRPPAIRAPPRDEQFKTVVHPGIMADRGVGEGVQAAQHVEVPPRRMVEAGELRVDGLRTQLAAVETVPEERSDRSGSGLDDSDDLAVSVGEDPAHRPGDERIRRSEASLPRTCGSMCGAEGTRTPDPLHAMQMRYQLRHSPGTAARRSGRQLAES